MRTRQIETHDGASVSATEVTAEGNKTRVGVTTQAFDGHFDLHSVLKINNADIALCERRNASFIYSRVPRKSYVSRTFNCGLEDGILVSSAPAGGEVMQVLSSVSCTARRARQ